LLLVVLSLLVLKMTEISIRDFTAEGSLVYYSIKVGDWEMDDHTTTLNGAFKMITHNLKWDYREYENELERDDG
jgi:hypothetical protein